MNDPRSSYKMTSQQILPSSGSQPVHCAEPGCGQSTRESKPYCSDHVERHDYVTGIVSDLAQCKREHEEVQKRGWRAVQTDGLTVTEILNHLRVYGDRTVGRLARELNLDADLVEIYAKAMERAGLVSTWMGSRKKTIVHIIEEESDNRAAG